MFSVDWPALLSTYAAGDSAPIAAVSCVLAWTGRKLVLTCHPGGRALGEAFATGILTAVTLHALLR